MSGGVWKDAAMRLYDATTNFEGAVAAYMHEQDGPHRNHLDGTWRKLAAARKHAYDLAQEDRRAKEADPMTCPRCGDRAVHVILGGTRGTNYYVQCRTCGLAGRHCETSDLADLAWQALRRQMKTPERAGAERLKK